MILTENGLNSRYSKCIRKYVGGNGNLYTRSTYINKMYNNNIYLLIFVLQK